MPKQSFSKTSETPIELDVVYGNWAGSAGQRTVLSGVVGESIKIHRFIITSSASGLLFINNGALITFNFYVGAGVPFELDFRDNPLDLLTDNPLIINDDQYNILYSFYFEYVQD